MGNEHTQKSINTIPPMSAGSRADRLILTGVELDGASRWRVKGCSMATDILSPDIFRSSLMGGLDRNGLSAGSNPVCGMGCFDVKGGAITDQMPRPSLLPPSFN